jgi:hypothetical protein
MVEISHSYSKSSCLTVKFFLSKMHPPLQFSIPSFKTALVINELHSVRFSALLLYRGNSNPPPLPLSSWSKTVFVGISKDSVFNSAVWFETASRENICTKVSTIYNVRKERSQLNWFQWLDGLNTEIFYFSFCRLMSRWEGGLTERSSLSVCVWLLLSWYD